MKRALVISGGGSKGAFAVGVIKQLQQIYPSLAFDIYVGTSTGSLIVPLAAIDEISLLEEIYTTQSKGTIVKELRIGDRLNTDSVFDANPLWNLSINILQMRGITRCRLQERNYISTQHACKPRP
jgi:predicted acylesterase/phospholipase RssA